MVSKADIEFPFIDGAVKVVRMLSEMFAHVLGSNVRNFGRTPHVGTWR